MWMITFTGEGNAAYNSICFMLVDKFDNSCRKLIKTQFNYLRHQCLDDWAFGNENHWNICYENVHYNVEENESSNVWNMKIKSFAISDKLFLMNAQLKKTMLKNIIMLLFNFHKNSREVPNQILCKSTWRTPGVLHHWRHHALLCWFWSSLQAACAGWSGLAGAGWVDPYWSLRYYCWLDPFS